MRKLSILYGVFLLFNCHTILGQNPYIKHFTTSQGLPSNTVYSIFPDSHQFLWFGTDAGVVKYDGSQFINYRNTDGLSSNEVVKIKEDHFGRIWFFNLNGKLNYYFNNRIYNEHSAPFLDSLKSKDFFRDFYEDKDKTIYFYYNDNRDIFALDSHNIVKKHRTASIKVKNLNSIPEGNFIKKLFRASTGEFILLSGLGKFRLKNLDEPLPAKYYPYVTQSVYSTGEHCYFVVPFDDVPNRTTIRKYLGETLVDSFYLPMKSHITLSNILEDQLGYTWVTTYDHGVYCLKDHKVVEHYDIDEALGLMQDNENNIWISSHTDGIYKISPYIHKHRHYPNSFFRGKGLTSLGNNTEIGIWMTTAREIYLFRNNQFIPLDFNNRNTTFNFIYQLKNGCLLAGGSSADFYAFKGIRPDIHKNKILFNPPRVSPIRYKKISINKKDDQICGPGHSFLYIFKPDSLFDNPVGIFAGERIYNTFYNRNNDLIINTKKNYILKNNKLEIFKELECFSDKLIISQVILNDSSELFNIEGDSLFILSGNKICNLSSKLGYPIDLKIRKILYNAPDLYFSTNRTIYQCQDPVNAMMNKPVSVHPLDIAFDNITDLLIRNDSLYIASNEGLTVIPSGIFNSAQTCVPIPYFQSILINDQASAGSGQEINLKGNNKITFNFGSINYSSQRVLFSYKLIGADTGWTIGSGRTVVYRNLPVGDYILMFRVKKPASNWSRAVTCNISIKATFWRHPMFLIILVLLAIGTMAMLIIRRKNMQIRRRETDYILLTLEQKALQAMMNPHFIFNALGSIQNYILQNRSREAGVYLSQFARLIRQNLNTINSATIQIEEEIDRLKNYLDLEKLRMENKFDYSIEVNESLDDYDARIPSMIIQPFVENAIWHGISSIDYPGFIGITFSKPSKDSVLIIIEDNGIGIEKGVTFNSPDEEHLKMGIEMTRKRLQIIGKKFEVETSVGFYEKYPGTMNPGTRVEIIVPLT